MIISRLLKQHFTSILITLLLTMQISACGSGNNPTAATADIISDPGTDPATGKDTGTATDTGTDKNSTTADIYLSWAAPVEREDNAPISLSEIAGFKVYFGTVQGQYTNNIVINDGSAVGHTLTSLPVGDTYYFVLTTLDTEGRESQFSPEVVITT